MKKHIKILSILILWGLLFIITNLIYQLLLIVEHKIGLINFTVMGFSIIFSIIIFKIILDLLIHKTKTKELKDE